MRIGQARRIKELEKENARLKKLLADLSLDNSKLKKEPWETSERVQSDARQYSMLCP